MSCLPRRAEFRVGFRFAVPGSLAAAMRRLLEDRGDTRATMVAQATWEHEAGPSTISQGAAQGRESGRTWFGGTECRRGWWVMV